MTDVGFFCRWDFHAPRVTLLFGSICRVASSYHLESCAVFSDAAARYSPALPRPFVGSLPHDVFSLGFTGGTFTPVVVVRNLRIHDTLPPRCRRRGPSPTTRPGRTRAKLAMRKASPLSMVVGKRVPELSSVKIKEQGSKLFTLVT